MTADTQAQGDLPEPAYVLTSMIGNFISFRAKGFNHKKGDGLYTADQVRAAIAAALQGRAQEGEPSDAVDAARYRWLRDHVTLTYLRNRGDFDDCRMRYQIAPVLIGMTAIMSEIPFDEAVDYARAALAQAQKERT